ncbi:MAG: preprotein translocase subunit SecA, partial [Kiritimatiellia bacterium]
MLNVIKKVFGSKHERDIKLLGPLVERTNAFEVEYQTLSDEQLKAKTVEFRERLEKGEALDSLMAEAFATVKNACRRLCGQTFDVCGHDLAWDMVPFDVQIMGGAVLHQGKIAEMATGEGKTLVATLPLYLNALTGKNVHLVTTNDYLARRDSQWMGNIFTSLGLTTGCIQNQMTPAERREQYTCDITYGTNSEFGFDYLRDNGMAYDPESRVQNGYNFAIIDEIDSILIDEARTPLIISGPSPTTFTHIFTELKPSVEALVKEQRVICTAKIQEAEKLIKAEDIEGAQVLMYQVFHGMPKHKKLMHLLEDADIRKMHEQVESMMLTDMRKEDARTLREELLFVIEERNHDASLTEKGCEAMSPHDPDAYVLPDLVTEIAEIESAPDLTPEERSQRKQEIHNHFASRSDRIHAVDQMIRAYTLYEKDVEYVVQENQVLIVDEFTGRILPGRRWSDGLHQAVEAKEGVKIERETQTLATITIQNYFRMYDKLGGMTGTAETEASEFHEIYGLDVVVMKTNRPVRRVDGNDVIYKTQREKYKALIEEIRSRHESKQPVLVGTASVDSSELLSRMLKRAHIPHNVLNARNHESEADIVMRAGQPGCVTIATNMAGRGTDIKLGEGVVKIDREVILSQTGLKDKLGETTLLEQLIENPNGLHVIGSERHESRRIDRQLRGRCARQGDPGSSRFYISLEDDLMRLFGSDRIANIMSRLGLEEGQELEHKWLNRSIETAQRRVEQQNFAIRKRTLEYDDVMNKQREVVYGFRGQVVTIDVVRDEVHGVMRDVVDRRTEEMLKNDDDETISAYVEWVSTTFPVLAKPEEVREKFKELLDVADLVYGRVKEAYGVKVGMEDDTAVNSMERHVMLNIIDTHWQDYLRQMDGLRQGVGLRAYGQRDPLVEYKREAFDMFATLMVEIREDIASSLFRSTTSMDSYDSFMKSLNMVHEDVSLLGKRNGAGAQQARAPQNGSSNMSLDDL